MSGKAPETRMIKLLRAFLSFVLCVVIATMSMAICFNAKFLNSKEIGLYFSSYEYTCGVRDDFIEYAESVYERNGLEKSNIDNIISYDIVKYVVDSYCGYYISDRPEYSENGYTNGIDEICEDLRKDILLRIDESSQKKNDAALDVIMQSVRDYYAQTVEVNGLEKIKTVINIGTPASYAVMGVCLFFFVFIALILFFLGERRHRSLRAISISFLTAGLFNVCLAIIIYCISKIKTIDIYPVYISDLLMRYVNSSISVIIAAGLILIAISLSTATITWMIKIKGKR